MAAKPGTVSPKSILPTEEFRLLVFALTTNLSIDLSVADVMLSLFSSVSLYLGVHSQHCLIYLATLDRQAVRSIETTLRNRLANILTFLVQGCSFPCLVCQVIARKMLMLQFAFPAKKMEFFHRFSLPLGCPRSRRISNGR
ncbi:Lag1p [Saccharomyces cerevisiae FostersO]|nr:Lag1p [Saccharomyces cerevisiae FostersO]